MAHAKAASSKDISADAMWSRIGDFQGIDRWLGVVASCEAVDGSSRRKLTTVDGATIVEELLEEGDHFYRYKIIESPLPVEGYEAKLSVTPTGDSSCTVEWTARFTASGMSEEEAEALISQSFSGGLEEL